MNFKFKKFKKKIRNAFKPFKAKIIILGATDNAKRHILLKICLLIDIISKNNYTSFHFLNKQEKKEQKQINEFGSWDTNQILNKTIGREKFNEGSNFNVETIIFESNKLNIWDVSTDNMASENMKWQVWKNSSIGSQFLIYCVDASFGDKSLKIKERNELLLLLQDETLECLSFAVLFNNIETFEEEQKQIERLNELKQIYENLDCKQSYKLFGCSTKIIYNEDTEKMNYLTKNCNSVKNYKLLKKKDFKRYCKMDSIVDMMDWMVNSCL
ncbi:hypothetical protein QEN19_004236 [Hanseniaspora menglaensis]